MSDKKMKVVTFGEIMLRLSPEGHNRLFQTPDLRASFGGSESNVAVSLAIMGADASFVTRLPDNSVGRGAVSFLRGLGVGTDKISLGGDRLGVYYMESGAGERQSVCIYDRKNSAIAEASPDDFDWDEIFEGADWFHFSGITPALGGNLPEICEAACAAAHAHGVKISCDLNYRDKLWSREEAGRVMTRLCRYVDVCIGNDEDARDVFGIVADDGADGKESYLSVSRQLTEKFGFSDVAMVLRMADGSLGYELTGLIYDKKSGTAEFAPTHKLEIIDRIGAGDAFCAGLIYAMLSGMSRTDTVKYAVAASALKHTIEGDCNRATFDEVKKAMNPPKPQS